MFITTIKLTRTAGLSAVAAGLLFLAVQINHPQLDATFTTTGEYLFREILKIAMAVFALIGITGMYLTQVKKMGVLGLIGYLVLGAGYLILMSIQVVAAVVLPALAATTPGYVNDVLATATGGTVSGDIGLMTALNLASAGTYIAGGVIFGIALFRANVLARWAGALLAVGAAATIAWPLLPMLNERLFAVPTGVALIGLGYSLWRGQHIARTVATTSPRERDGAK